jgi:hypothetical protein
LGIIAETMRPFVVVAPLASAALLTVSACGGEDEGKNRALATQFGRELSATIFYQGEISKVVGVEPLGSSRIWKIVVATPGRPNDCYSIDLDRFKAPSESGEGTGWAEIACSAGA